jgi:precorrin-6Y C5,15-methyltransferase (decarboxylating)
MMGKISLIGLGDDGCVSLSSRSINEIAMAESLAGAARHLAFFPQFTGELIEFTSGLNAYISRIIEQAKTQDVCVLASGDPLFFGLGSRLIAAVQAAQLPIEVMVLPNVSSVQLACAKTLMSSNDLVTLSVHGRALKGLVAKLQQHDEVALLTDHENTPVVVANYLAKFNESEWSVAVCENLAGCNERIGHYSIAELTQLDEQHFSRLNVMLLRRGNQPYWGGYTQHCADEAYHSRSPLNGLITKAGVRAIAVAKLGLRRDSVMWDIGAGSGSIGIEAAKQAWQGQVFSLECNPDCHPMIENNQRRHKVDNLTLIKQKAPIGLAELPRPNAIFIGGSRGQIDPIIDVAINALHPKGTLILSAVTLDSVAQFYQLCQQRQLQFEVLMLQHAHSQPLAQYQRYQAENPIHLFVITKADNS